MMVTKEIPRVEENSYQVETVRLVVAGRGSEEKVFLFEKKTYQDAYGKRREFIDLPLLITHGSSAEQAVGQLYQRLFGRPLKSKPEKIWQSSPELVSYKTQGVQFIVEAFYSIPQTRIAANLPTKSGFEFLTIDQALAHELPEVTREFLDWQLNGGSNR